MSRERQAVCEQCYRMFAMRTNAKIQLCPACKAEDRKRKHREAQLRRYYANKQEAVQRRRKQNSKTVPELTIGDVQRMAERVSETGKYMSYGKMVAEMR